MDKICPKCKKKYPEIANYCTKCGIELEKNPNECSEQKTTLCRHTICADDDVYCAYCGSLTTYAKERMERNKNI